MLSNLESQLKQQGASDKIDDVLKEIALVHKGERGKRGFFGKAPSGVWIHVAEELARPCDEV